MCRKFQEVVIRVTLSRPLHVDCAILDSENENSFDSFFLHWSLCLWHEMIWTCSWWRLSMLQPHHTSSSWKLCYVVAEKSMKKGLLVPGKAFFAGSACLLAEQYFYDSTSSGWCFEPATTASFVGANVMQWKHVRWILAFLAITTMNNNNIKGYCCLLLVVASKMMRLCWV